MDDALPCALLRMLGFVDFESRLHLIHSYKSNPSTGPMVAIVIVRHPDIESNSVCKAIYFSALSKSSALFCVHHHDLNATKASWARQEKGIR